MKANATKLPPPSHVAQERSGGRTRRGIAAAVVGLVVLGACTSDPGPRRVAEDIIKAESFANPELNEECLLDALDGYENDELVAIAEGLDRENSADQAEAQDALAQYQADLEACL